MRKDISINLKRKLYLVVLIGLIVSSLVFPGCSGETPATETPASTPASPAATVTTVTDWWDELGEPEYGGTITFGPSKFSAVFDPFLSAYDFYQYYMEPMFYPDWTVDREEWSFPTPLTPVEYQENFLVESWEWSDPLTQVFHIREGVYWHDKEPVNGREFTAYDVEHHYHRMMGNSSGYTTPCPFWRSSWGSLQSITATDKYTVVCKYEKEMATNNFIFRDLFGRNFIEAPEVVEQGLIDDWQYAIGTGPWILTDFVSGSSASFIRNTSYWGYDERHPENQLPYADEFNIVFISDIATRVAALRSGQIDFADDLPWQQADSLSNTNPELNQSSMSAMAPGLWFRVDLDPFSDINVRKALSMSIPRDTIAETYYGGMVDPTPCGPVTPYSGGYSFVYEDWPQSLKDEFVYNPDKARELLAAAGYPDGFETNVVVASSWDTGILEIMKAYFLEVGVDMDIEVMDPASAMAYTSAKNHTLSWAQNTGSPGQPYDALSFFTTGHRMNYCNVSDPVYDALNAQVADCTTTEELKQVCVQMEQYNLEQHWCIRLFLNTTFNVYQPQLKGYLGENTSRTANPGGAFWARLWIDQD